jgi:Domain of unknown function (DUF5134)
VGGPAWLTGIFAAASLAVAVYCAGRLIAARRWRRPTELDTDGAHVVMGTAMAGMLVAGLRTLPSTAWEVVFAGGTAWFGYRMLRARRGARPSPWRTSHPLPHLVECAAMVFMFLILPASAAAGRLSTTMAATESRFSFLTLPLAVFLFGYVVWVGDRVPLRAPALATGSGSGYGSGSAVTSYYLAPRCAAICKITMGITMGYTLILML